MDFFTLENLFTLIMLVLLQAVLGFDNLLYISIESKRVVASQQSFVRRMGIGVAIALRIVLLFVLISAIGAFKTPITSVHWSGVLEGEVTFHALIVLIGGAFIIYTAIKEIYHMLGSHELEHGGEAGTRSVAAAVTWIVIMNLVFSFDSILSAMALTDNFWTMALAIVISGLMMIYLADTVAEFLKKNRLYEVLGLFILLIVGVMLLSEGGHLAHLRFFGYPVEPMAKSTFYFVIVVMVAVDFVQGRYQRRILAETEAREKRAAQVG
jgi:predicted tellurium resistance membrane protein TerC